jgi:pimeloyl-ACP methyl ester carboxylesterase
MGAVSRFLDLDSCRLHYFEYEHPDPRGTVLLVHGLGTSASTWLKILPTLISEHHVIAVDLPGFGFSSLKPGTSFYTLSEHCTALSALVERTVHDRLTLIGHSFGGWISVRLAAANRGSLLCLVLVDTAGIPYPGAERLRELFTIDSPAHMRKLLDALWYRYPWYFKPFASAIYHEMTKRNVNGIVASIGEEDSLVGELSLLTMPVSVVWGREDRVISPAAVQVLKRMVPQASVCFIDGCGHVPQLERPAELKKILSHILMGAGRGLD